ncbi:MAG: tape measure protein [Azoarcus sp.]|jgi:tape measure domain-containing protein|nr:tape measure protein [Azoarcus sp.]
MASGGDLTLALKIQADLKRAQDELARLAGGLDATGQSANHARQGLESINGQLARGASQVKAFAAAWLSIGQLRNMIDLADEYGQMASRIKMATASAEEYQQVQARLLQTAKDTFRPLTETQELYIRTSDALRSMGYSTNQAMDVTDSLSYLFVTNAASAERADTAITAFSKALQKGKVDTLGWTSLLAAVPTLVDKIAAATGKSAEEVRRLGAEGKLAVTDLTEGLRRSVTENLQDVLEMPTALKDAFTNLRTALQDFLGRGNEATGTTKALVAAVNMLAANLNVLATSALAAGVGAFGRYIAVLSASAVTKAKVAIDARRLALAELEAARAAVTAAVAHNAMAAATGRASVDMAAAQARLAAAQTAVAASATAMTGALRTAGAFLLGPVGLPMAIAAVAAGLLLFRDNAGELDRSMADLNVTLDQSREKFKALGEAQQIAALAGVREEIAETERKYRQLAETLANTVDNELRKGRKQLSGRDAGQEAILRGIRDAAVEAGKGGEAAFGDMARQVERLMSKSEDFRLKLLGQVSGLEGFSKRTGYLSNRLRAFEGDANAAANAVNNLGVALKNSGSEDAQKLLEQLEEKLAEARDPSVLGKARRKLAGDAEATPEQITAIEAAARALDKLNEARKKTSREKRDPVAEANLGKQRALTQQLAQAEQQLTQARQGVFESATRARDALEIWLATDKEALKLAEKERAARRTQADAVDAATAAYKRLADAKARSDRIKTSVEGMQLRLLELDGKTAEAAKERFRQQYRELIADIEADIAAGGEEGARALKIKVELEGKEAISTQLDGVLDDIQKIQDALGRDENTLQTQIDAGVLTEIEGRDRLLDIHQKTAAALERIRPLLVELSAMPGDIGEQAAAALQKLDDQATTLRANVGALQGALKDGLTAGITAALTGLAKGTMDLRDAVTALGQAVLDAMLKMAVEGLAQQATNGIMGLIGNLTGTGADKGADKTAEAAAVTSLSTAASGLTGATGSLTQAVVGLTTAANTFASASGGGLAASGNALAGLANGGNANAGSAAGGEGAGALTGAGALLANAAGQLLGAGSSLAGAGGDLSSGGSALSAVATLLTTAASLLMTASSAETTSGVVSAVGAVAGAAAADGGLIPGFSPSERADNIPAWLTAGEFVTRRRVMRQPGALAFMESFNRRGMDAVRAWAKRMRLPGYADGGPVLPAPPSMPDRTALIRQWEPAQAGGNATPVTNRIGVYTYFDLDQMNAALAKSRDFEKVVVKIAQTNGMAIQRSWQ